jgi:hypothetical protein
MEKQLFFGAVLTFFGVLLGGVVIVKLHLRRQKRLDAEAIEISHESDTVRPVTFEEAWDASDDEFMRKYAHVTCRDYEREDKIATQQLIAERTSYRKLMEAAADRAWDRIATKARPNKRFCSDFADMQGDLLLARGENGYHGSMADTQWTVADTRQLNALLRAGAKEFRGKMKRKAKK